MKRVMKSVLVLSVLGLAGCVVMPPSGPSRQALPGSRQSFEQFNIDNAACQQYASAQIGGRTSAENANDSAAASAIAGTLIGAVAGAAIGGNSHGAGVGAGIGLLTGAMVGLGAAETSYYASQRRFDSAFYQCMYARGHKVPMSSRYAQAMRSPSNAPAPATPPPNAAVPPPNAPPPPASFAAPYVPPYWPSTPPPNAPPPR